MKDILQENKRRWDEYFGHYNPITGEGSLIPRFAYKVDKDVTLWLPEPMKEEPMVRASLSFDSLHEFLNQAHKEVKSHVRKKYIDDGIAEFFKIRLKYDFEFWAATCAKITTRRGTPINFVLNYPQRYLLRRYEMMRTDGRPIRAVLVKARQWGGSTLTQLYEKWIMLFVETGFNSAVVTAVEAQARHIRGMFSFVAENHPSEIMDITLVPYEQSKNRKIKGRGNIIGVGSMEKPENLRSFTFQLLHLSEVASFKATTLRKPEDLIQALRGGIPSFPNTMIVLESTAKGIGNFFHNEWMAAKRKESGYDAVFIPWFFIEEYRTPVKDKKKFIDRMTERDWELWGYGATLEGINWYNIYKTSENYDDWRMMEEMPSTSEEAFQSSGQRVFAIKDTIRMREHCCEPEVRGELQGQSITGPESLERIGLDKNPHGNLWIWTMPDWDGPQMKYRYVVFVDIGGAHHKSDKSVIRVLDRYWMLEGGKPEFVATWRGNIDHDILAWKAVQVAKWYNNALLAVENNSLDKMNDGRGHFFTILDEIAEYYNDLFYHSDPDKIKEGLPIKYGFHTNRNTKPMIIDTLKAALRDDEYIERDKRALDEMDSYETKPDGTLGAVDGAFDDMVITTAGDVWIALKYLPMPTIATRETSKRKSIISEASI